MLGSLKDFRIQGSLHTANTSKSSSNVMVS